MKMHTPYQTSTGIKIGKMYTPPKQVETDADMLAWQQVLAPSLQRYERKYLGKILYCAALLGVLCAYGIIYA